MSEAFLTLADTLVEDFDPLSLFQRLVDHCAGLLDVEAVGVMMIDALGRLRTTAASSEEADFLEVLQLQKNSGPCVDSYHEQRQISVPDLSAERERWPEVADAALAAGFASVHTVPLRLHEHVVGAVNLLRTGRGPLAAEDQHLAQALADATMLALMQWSAEKHPRGEIVMRLQSVIAAKSALEIAKGMIVEYADVSFSTAARMLRDYATEQGVRLIDAVHGLVNSELAPAAVAAGSGNSTSP
ncbi:GAF domain-containing protein [Streptomyces bathyalis]|uniref:GAF domain-containing protein n=1 Tax=Streptomyces bathyalis TaxID=2710756 RepID=A0A7T1TA82_9ACTN|nr:GAF domain-containing protein [Streptomyces bathyalis]QPP09213.1 GAF domain-containing protein [Streptomyces bathyalis]